MNNKQSFKEDIQALIQKYEEEQDKERKEYEDRITTLEAEVTALSERDFHSLPLDRFVADHQLRQRLSRLGDSPPLDTVIREAGVVLENRIKTIGEAPRAYGSRMIENLMDPKNGSLIFSDHPNEQRGVMNLYLGALQFIRNPPMHKLIEYPEHTARILIKLVDALLQLLEEANPKKEITLDAVRLLLKRIRIPKGQIALYKALYDAGDKGLTNAELAESTGKTRQGLSGVLGALGNRINNTPGFESQGNTGAVLEMIREGYDDYRYIMRPILREAIEAEDIFSKYELPKIVKTRRLTTRAEFLSKCPPEAQEFFEAVLENAKTRGYVIYWGVVGFSIRGRLTEGENYASFLYGHPPNRFRFYFDSKVLLDRNKDSEFRRELLDFGLFTESGQYTLNSYVESENKDELLKLQQHIFNRIRDFEIEFHPELAE
jgi:hypothetical protein